MRCTYNFTSTPVDTKNLKCFVHDSQKLDVCSSIHKETRPRLCAQSIVMEAMVVRIVCTRSKWILGHSYYRPSSLNATSLLWGGHFQN